MATKINDDNSAINTGRVDDVNTWRVDNTMRGDLVACALLSTINLEGH